MGERQTGVKGEGEMGVKGEIVMRGELSVVNEYRFELLSELDMIG